MTAPKLYHYRGDMLSVARLSELAGCSYAAMIGRLRLMDAEAAVSYVRTSRRGLSKMSEPWLGFSHVPYEQDTVAQRVISHGPYTHEQIGEMLALSKQRVHQIERDALKKLRRRLQKIGMSQHELTEWLTEFTRGRDERERDSEYR
jgi:hypothetical protein